jgi:hypothetical protein
MMDNGYIHWPTIKSKPSEIRILLQWTIENQGPPLKKHTDTSKQPIDGLVHGLMDKYIYIYIYTMWIII